MILFNNWYKKHQCLCEFIRTIGSVCGGIGGVLATLRVFHII